MVIDDKHEHDLLRMENENMYCILGKLGTFGTFLKLMLEPNKYKYTRNRYTGTGTS